MSLTVTGGTKWNPLVSAGGPEIRLDYTCPTCHRSQTINLQTDVWQAPMVPDGEDASGHPLRANESTAEVRAWEQRRADGTVEHEVMDAVTTQLWCHQCQKGTEVTLTEQ